MSRPNHCPNCGKALPEGNQYAMPIISEGSHASDGGYDVYCPSCRWSGDIMPDAEQGVHPGTGSRRAG